MRNKLIEIIRSVQYNDNGSTIGNNFQSRFVERIADHLIENGVTVGKDNNVPSKWIPVTERLPEKGTGDVLVVKQFRGKSYVDMGEVIGEKACCYSDEYCINPREHIFTHWMPLPEPPEVTV